MQCMLLKDVTRQSNRWKVLVRLARIWEFRDQQTPSILYEVDFVAVDRQGGTMEGYIPNNRVDQFKEYLKEGTIYTIEHFVLSDAKKSYKSTDHPYRIRFTQRTKLTEVLSVPENFPLYAYNAKPFSFLSTRMNDNTILSDMVGLVNAVTDISIAPSTQQRKRQIFVTDTRERAVITLWGDHAENFEAEDIKLESELQPVVVLFVGMTVSQFSGLLAFKSTSVTKWYINPAIPEVASIQKIAKDQSYKIEDQGPSKAKAEAIEMTLPALNSSSPYDRIGDRFKMNIQLIDLITKENWWYLSCKSCWKKMQPSNSGFRCPRCSSDKAQPRYKVTYSGIDIVEEGLDNQTIGHFTFLGQDGVALIGKDEALLVPDTTVPPMNTPRHLLGPIGKRYAVIAELTDNSLDSENLCFQVNTPDEIRSDDTSANQVTGPPAITTEQMNLASESQDSEIAKSPIVRVEETMVHTPPDDTIASIAEKTKHSGSSRKRDITPPSRSAPKKGKSGRPTSSKQLAFTDEDVLNESAGSKSATDS